MSSTAISADFTEFDAQMNAKLSQGQRRTTSMVRNAQIGLMAVQTFQSASNRAIDQLFVNAINFGVLTAELAKSQTLFESTTFLGIATTGARLYAISQISKATFNLQQKRVRAKIRARNEERGTFKQISVRTHR